jgi:hypothetical protein
LAITAAFRGRFDAVLLQDVGHRAPSVIVSEIRQRSLDSAIAPFPVLPCHTHDESLHFGQNPWSAQFSITTAIVLLRNQPAMPCQQRLRRYYRCDLRQPFRSKNFGFDRQVTLLVVGESHAAMADLLSKNTIFFHQISDGMLLMLVHPSSQNNQQKSKGIQTRLHRRIIAQSTIHPGSVIRAL